LRRSGESSDCQKLSLFLKPSSLGQIVCLCLGWIAHAVWFSFVTVLISVCRCSFHFLKWASMRLSFFSWFLELYGFLWIDSRRICVFLIVGGFGHKSTQSASSSPINKWRWSRSQYYFFHQWEHSTTGHHLTSTQLYTISTQRVSSSCPRDWCLHTHTILCSEESPTQTTRTRSVVHSLSLNHLNRSTKYRSANLSSRPWLVLHVLTGVNTSQTRFKHSEDAVVVEQLRDRHHHIPSSTTFDFSQDLHWVSHRVCAKFRQKLQQKGDTKKGKHIPRLH